MTQFMEKWLGVKAPAMSDWRRTVSGDLTSAFDFKTAGRRPSVERPGAVPAFTGRWKPAPPGDQKMPTPEPGTRPARPLPYQPEATLRVAKGTLRLSLTNTGAESVHFSLYPYAGELPKPRHFDVTRRIEQVFKGGDTYDLVIIGPNGFRREFAGRTHPDGGAEVASAPQGSGGSDLWIILANEGDEEITFTLKALAYAKRDRQVKVKPGKQRKVHWNTDHGWYDVEVKIAGNTEFRRRLMGHVENGRPSTSG
ncbi:phospholipase domain-containing protein [Spirillospora sp. NPDC048911]|uniref:phospholipase domain-containing protein n=1 Tax=Spirillospora sp. NPDC048911 TaxID=3364527 RepID=UPI0037211FA3